MHKGKVKWFNTGLGHGIIKKEAGGELFVYRKDVLESYLNPGSSVQFEIGRGGPCAVNVRSL